MQRIYLDHNATTPLRHEVADAIVAALKGVHNASSVHQEGRQARAQIDLARVDILSAFSASDGAELIFTSGGTEACNLALQVNAPIERLIVSTIEHKAVLSAATTSQLPIDFLPVTAEGVIDKKALSVLLEDPRPALVAVMLANNETGAIQPIAEIAPQIKTHGSLLFCDAVQAAGKMPLSFAKLGADMMSLSAHKFAGPTGIGALIIRKGVNLTPLISGGGQELGRRSGTENYAGIIGMQAAVNHLTIGNANLRDELEQKLRNAFPDIVIFADAAPRLHNTSCFALTGMRAENLVMALDLAGFSVSAGAACASGKVSESHVLAAMGVNNELAQSAIRISLGADNRLADIDALIDALQKMIMTKPMVS